MALRGTAHQANTSTSTTCVVNVAGIGIQSGDIILLCISGGGGGTNTFTFPSGFASITSPTSLPNLNLNSGSTAASAIKTAGASEPSSYTITSNKTDFQTAVCRVYSGRSGTITDDISTAPLNITCPHAVPATGVTAAASDDVVVFYPTNGYEGSGTPAYTTPTGFANSDLASNLVTFSPIMFSADDVGVSSGATGTISTTMSDGAGKLYTVGCYVLSLAAGGSTNSAVIAWTI